MNDPEEAAILAQEEDQTSLAIVAPPLTSLLLPPGSLAQYQLGLLQQAQELALRANVAVEEAKRGVASAIAAEEPAMTRSWKVRLARRLREQKRQAAFLAALNKGYLPIPRLPALQFRFVQEVMPPDVLDILAEAKQAGLFEEFRICDGTPADQNGWPVSTAGGRGRIKHDPILIGMIGGEMFPLAWWR